MDGSVVALIGITTPLRPDAEPAVRQLHDMGLTTTILSGDNAAAVDMAANVLGIDHALGELTPQGKLDALRQLRIGRRGVLMVGDGINDAPALAAADVGCAIGSGSEAALATSDIALLGSTSGEYRPPSLSPARRRPSSPRISGGPWATTSPPFPSLLLAS